jgi:hypothetical protein
MYKLLYAIAIIIAVSCGGHCLAGTYQITPSEDSWVYSFAPDTNYGRDTGIATDIHNMSFAGFTYFKFTLPALKNEIIQSATLHLYQWNGAGYGEGPTAVQLFSNNDWSETTITWNNSPAGTGTGLAACSDGHSHQGWSSWTFPWNSAHGRTFTLRVAENSSGDQSHWWYSKEWSDSSQRPYLEISTVPVIFWRNTSTGQNAVWYLNGTTVTGSVLLDNVSDPTWKIVGTDYFNGYGKPDILWRNTSTGQNLVWYMNGSTVTGSVLLDNVSDATWKIMGTADFNGDGNPDILWRNTSTGQNAVWHMNGVTVVGFVLLDSVSDLSWTIVGIGDFNSDGKPDILWRNASNGQNLIWYMNGATVTGSAPVDSVGGLNWKIMGTGDFNEDGKPDILWRNSSTGQNLVWYMNGTTVTGFVFLDSVSDVNWEIVGR